VSKPFLEPAVNAQTDMLVGSTGIVPYSERSDLSFSGFLLQLLLKSFGLGRVRGLVVLDCFGSLGHLQYY
jgi:hypothetical protein